MGRESAFFFVLLIILTVSSPLAVKVQSARASEIIYIRADGSIDPPDAPISTPDNVTYTLTGNITSEADGIVVERDNIVVDGSGFVVEGTGTHEWHGIYLDGRSNVTIQNTNIKNFYWGIGISNSSNNRISGDTITNCTNYGIYPFVSSNNNIVGNNITNNSNGGIWLSHSPNNSILGNNITNNAEAVWLYYASNNSISGNHITNNGRGVELTTGSNYNSVSGNNITANGDEGIWLVYSTNNSISGNNIAANKHAGIWLQSSSNNNSVSGNTFTGDGLLVWDSFSNIVEDNTVNGRPLVYLEGVADFNVEDAGQVVLLRCDRIRVENLSISQTSAAIILWETHNSIISGNKITANSWSPIELVYSCNNSISGNIMTNNIEGMSLFCSSNNIVNRNRIANNSRGIRLSESSDYNIVSGNNIADSVIGISLSGSSNNRIDENNMTDNPGVAIEFREFSNNNSISGNNITDNAWSGIDLSFSSNNNVSGNNITNNGDGGIGLVYCSNNSINGNTIVNNSRYGIELYSSPNNDVSGNMLTGDGFHVVQGSYSNIVENNTVNGKPLVYLEGVTDYSVTDAGQVILVECDRINVENLNLSRASVGVELLGTNNSIVSGNTIGANDWSGIDLSSSSSNNSINDNTITDGGYGINLHYSSGYESIIGNMMMNNSIVGNRITANRVGIRVEYCFGTNIVNNEITDNDFAGLWLFSSNSSLVFQNRIERNYFAGIILDIGSNNNTIIENDVRDNLDNMVFEHSVDGMLVLSSDNTIFHNNFVNGAWNVLMNFLNLKRENVWDNGYPSGGNYWSDYKGTDANQDGIGDTPYIIDAYNIDHYPLVTPYIIPEFPSFYFLPLLFTATLLVAVICRRKHH